MDAHLTRTTVATAGVCLILSVVLSQREAVGHPSSGIVVDKTGSVYFVTIGSGFSRLDSKGNVKCVPLTLNGRRPSDPHKLAMDDDGSLYLMGWAGIWKVTPEEGISVVSSRDVEVSLPSGKKEEAHIHWNTALAVDRKGNLYCVEYTETKCRLLRLSPEGQVTVVAGASRGFKDGQGSEAEFQDLRDSGMAFGKDGSLYLTDAGSSVRRVTKDGTVSTIAGSTKKGMVDGKAEKARFNGAVGISIDRDGNLYVADSLNRRIRKVDPAGVVTTLAGSGEEKIEDGPAHEASFSRPAGIAVGPDGSFYVLDSTRRIRKIAGDGEVATLR